MKHFFYLLLALTLFSACSSDDKDDEVFITDEALAKETLKNTWILQDWNFSSNSKEFDKAMNASAKNTLKTYVSSLQFKFDASLNADLVISETRAKDDGIGLGEVDFYSVNKDRITVKEKDGSYTTYTFKISENTLIMQDTLTKSILEQMLNREGMSKEVIDEFMKIVPSDFSCTQTMYLKKK